MYTCKLIQDCHDKAIFKKKNTLFYQQNGHEFKEEIAAFGAQLYMKLKLGHFRK
jgi:hypothetical protein